MARRVLAYIRKNGFENGFFSIFGLTQPFEGAVHEIYNCNIQSALKSDQEAIVNDFSKVFKREAEIIDVQQK